MTIRVVLLLTFLSMFSLPLLYADTGTRAMTRANRCLASLEETTTLLSMDSSDYSDEYQEWLKHRLQKNTRCINRSVKVMYLEVHSLPALPSAISVVGAIMKKLIVVTKGVLKFVTKTAASPAVLSFKAGKAISKKAIKIITKIKARRNSRKLLIKQVKKNGGELSDASAKKLSKLEKQVAKLQVVVDNLQLKLDQAKDAAAVANEFVGVFSGGLGRLFQFKKNKFGVINGYVRSPLATDLKARGYKVGDLFYRKFQKIAQGQYSGAVAKAGNITKGKIKYDSSTLFLSGKNFTNQFGATVLIRK